jgi:hypothetical protein
MRWLPFIPKASHIKIKKVSEKGVAVSHKSFRFYLLGTVVLGLMLGLLSWSGLGLAQGSLQITGTVTNQSGSGVQNVSVYATDPSGSTVEYGPTTTASDGTYQLDVDPGTYDFHFDPASGSGLNPVVDSSVTVSANQTINVVVEPSIQTHTFSGTLTDANGNPLSGMGVTISNSTDSNSAEGVTDANGNFTMTALADTYNNISLSFPNGVPANWPTGFGLSENAGPLDLTSSNATQNLQLNMVPLTVVVNDSNGNPLSNIYVHGDSYNSNLPSFVVGSTNPVTSNFDFSGYTDASGSVTFMVPQGTTFDQSGGSTSSSNNILATPSALQTIYLPAPLTVNGTTTVTMNAPPINTHTFSGTLTDANGNPLSGMGVTISNSTDSNSAEGVTDANGNFTMTALADTYNNISLSFPNGVPANWPTGFGLSENAGPLDLTSSNATQNLQLNMVPLTVVVNDSNGNPLSNIYVHGDSYNSNLPSFVVGSTNPVTSNFDFSGYTDASGSVTFMVPQGTTFDQSGGSTSSSNNILATPSALQTIYLPAPLTVNGTTTVTMNAPPINTHTFSGTLTDANGNPLSGMGVTISNSTDSNSAEGVTDANGNFTMTALADTYNNISLSFPNGVPANWPTGFGLSENAGPLDLTSSNATQNLQLNMVPLTVVVNDSNGNPLSNIYVHGDSYNSNLPSFVVGSTNPVTSNFDFSGYTDASGSVTFMVPQGTTFDQSGGSTSSSNNILATPSALQTIYLPAPLTVNGTTTVTMNAPPINTHTFSGTLTDANGNPLSGMGVTISNSTDSNSAEGVTDANGNFTMTALADTYNNISLSFPNGVPANWPTGFGLSENAGPLDLTSSNATQNLQLNMVPLTVVVNDSNGNPLSNIYVHGDSYNSNLPSFVVGSTNPVTSNFDFSGYTDASGSVTFMVPQGTTFDQSGGSTSSSNNILATPSALQTIYLPAPLTVNGTTTVVFQSSSPVPTITSAAIDHIDARVPMTFTVTTTGAPTPSITESGTLPPGITFTDNGNGTATFSGQASTTNNGIYAIRLTATSSAGTATQTLYITVDDAVMAPTIISANSLTETYGTPFSFTIDTTGDPIPTIKKVSGSGSLPSDVTLHDNGDGTATLSGNLTAASDNGVYTFTIQAKNNQGTVTQPFTLTVNRAPTIANIATQTATVGTAFSQSITTSDGYPYPTLSASGLPNGLTLADNGNGTATISGTPTTGDGGTYSVTITVTNSLGTTTETYTLKVNEAPTITSASSVTATIGTALSFQVTSTGYPAPNYSLTGALPSGVTFHPGTGILSGTPRAGTAGTYPVTITATNSTGTVTQSFTLVVS